MSDVFKTKYDFKKFKSDVVLDTDHSLQYLNRQCISSEDIVYTVHITNDVLKSWQDFKAKGIVLEFSYIQILNCFLAENHAILIRRDCQRLEELFRKLCSKVQSKFKGKRGREYLNFAAQKRKIVIRQGDLLTTGELQQELREIKAAKESLEKENRELHSRAEELYERLLQEEELREKACGSLTEARADIAKITQENVKLWEYFDKFSELKGFENCGKAFSEIKERQQRRKIRELKTYVEKALWFAETFGLKLSSVRFKDEAGEHHSIDYHAEDGKRKSYKDLSEEEKEKIQQVLYIADSFCISEAAYHELSMTDAGENLPRSYLVRECKNHLNSFCHIKRTPGEAEGAELDLESELKNVIRQKVDLNQFSEDSSQNLKVKISGDGAKMTRMTDFVIMSFSLLDSDDVMSSKGCHTIGIVKGVESYDLLKNSFSNIFSTVNQLIKSGKICVDGQDIPIEIFVGGDYKFLLLLLGMKGATSDHACIWCVIHKNERFDMSKPEKHYTEECWARSLMKIREWVVNKKYSCEHPPLLDVPLENVVLDELHLMLRVTDILTRNLVREAINWDKEDNFNKRPCDRKQLHLESLIAAINSCGVCFKVWEKKNADGGGSGTYDFTSLMGSDKKLLLKNLPEKLQGVIKPNSSSTVINIWKDFCELYSMLGIQAPSDDDVTDYFDKAKKWIQLFLSLGGVCDGYSKANVTPYMHSMVYHAPNIMRKHNGVKHFTGQGVEKNNDDCRRVHLSKSNKWDAAGDVLLVTKRVEALSKLQRTPRTYRKRSADYWEHKLKEKRAKHKSKMDNGRQQSQDNASLNQPQNIENMSPAELRAGLKTHGIKTRVRNVKRLQEMYLAALKNTNV